MKEIRNAVIKSTHLGYEGHGLFSFMLHLDYGGAGQGFGGYCLWNLRHENNNCIWGATVIEKILKTVGVQAWEDLTGKHIKVIAEHHKVYGICGFLTEDWFYINDLEVE